MNVLLITEDFRNDQYIVQPIVEAMFSFRGIRAKIRVLTDPLMGGVEQALDSSNIRDVVEQYQGMVDLFLLFVDRDCDPNRVARVQSLEQFAATILQAPRRFVGTVAIEELEVWCLAAVDPLPIGWTWNEILAECHPKEGYFEPYARIRKLEFEIGGGRRTLGREAAGRYRRVRQLCAADVQALEARV